MNRTVLHVVVFVLALLSFACLLGQFYGVWTMHVFGCWVLPPATALLAFIAYRHRGEARGLGSPWTWIVQGQSAASWRRSPATCIACRLS